MALSMKASSRYNSYNSRSSTSSSHFSDPSSSAKLKSVVLAPAATSRALARPKPSDTSHAKPPNLTAMMKNLVSRTKSGSGSSNRVMRLVIPPDPIAQDLKKTARKQGIGPGFSELPRKLFGEKKKKKKSEVKALTDLKGNGNGNARTLAMVLRSKRELLSSNKEMEMEIAELKLTLERKTKEVEFLEKLL